MALGKKWVGNLYGTNTGNLYVTLSGEDTDLSGKIRLNDPIYGIIIYDIKGAFANDTLEISGAASSDKPGLEFGDLSATAKMNSRGELEGDWETSIGSAGTFVLFSHDRSSSWSTSDADQKERLFSVRQDFGGIAVDSEQLIGLANKIQKEFSLSEVVVTVLAGTEKSCLLKDFDPVGFATDRATLFKLFARQRQANGIDQVVVVEFGPQTNYAMTQGPDEAWVLGTREILRHEISQLERKYATNFRRFGFGINQLLILGAIVYLPSLPSLPTRAALMFSVLILAAAVVWLHGRFLPNAELYLSVRPKSFRSKFLPSAISWIIAVSSAVVAALLAQFLQGQLSFSQ